MNDWNAYHFVGSQLWDGSPVPDDGVTLKYNGDLVMGYNGFHACRDINDAFWWNFAGDTICRVYCSGEIIEHQDRLVCSCRTIVARRCATAMLRDYARACALDVIHLWDAPKVVVRFLESGDHAILDDAKSILKSIDVSVTRTMNPYARVPRLTAAWAVRSASAATAEGPPWSDAKDAASHALMASSRTTENIQRQRLAKWTEIAFESAPRVSSEKVHFTEHIDE